VIHPTHFKGKPMKQDYPCRNGELIIQKEPPKLSGNYEKLYLSGREKRLRHLSVFKREIINNIKLLDLTSGSKLLEVGSGVGGFQLMELANFGYECTGVEIVKGWSHIAKRVASYFDLELEMVAADAVKLPFSDDSFDAVMSNNFFSHVTDIAAALKEQLRVLKVGGKCLIKDGNILFPLSAYNMLVLYAIKSRGKHGGIKWLLNRHKVIPNIYNFGYEGTDENMKSLGWWKNQIKKHENVSIEKATTDWTHFFPGLFSRLFEPFLGSIVIVVKKE